MLKLMFVLWIAFTLYSEGQHMIERQVLLKCKYVYSDHIMFLIDQYKMIPFVFIPMSMSALRYFAKQIDTQHSEKQADI